MDGWSYLVRFYRPCAEILVPQPVTFASLEVSPESLERHVGIPARRGTVHVLQVAGGACVSAETVPRAKFLRPAGHGRYRLALDWQGRKGVDDRV